MKLELVTRRDVSYVELQRDKKHSLGFTISDGTEEDSRPVVKSVKINSPAAKSFAVAKGDVVLSVNGLSTIGKKGKDVRQMLDDAGTNVNLQMQYKTYETRIQGSCLYRKQRLTLRLQKIKDSFGFLLRKHSKYSFPMEYPIISNIEGGSPLYKRGHVQDGDRLLMIDNINLSWMSLSYIALIMQAKDEAEFTFEYNVGITDLAIIGTKLDVEIDTPVPDLGISFSPCVEECMYISGIRQGSVAERSGIFSEGDIILSINGKNAKDLTISKAYFLLRKVKKCRKISFISNRRQDEIPNENDGISSTGGTVSTESFVPDIQASDTKHFNSPVSSNFTLDEQQKYNFENLCYVEQIKSMDKFQNTLSTMSSLKQTLSTLTSEAFRGTQTSLSQNCTSCKNTKHSIKLCASCLARMNVKCVQSMNVLRDLVAHFIRFSSNMFNENDDQLVNLSLKNVIHMLRETLPNMLPELQERLSTLSDKIAWADPSCSICDKEVKAVVLIAKQLLLILSVRDNSAEFTQIAEHLVYCLLEIEFPCFENSRYIQNSNTSENHNSSYDNLSELMHVGIDEEVLSNAISDHLKNNSEAESNCISPENSFSNLHLKTEICHDYLKLTHIRSTSESKESISPKSSNEPNAFCESYPENQTLPKELDEKSSVSSFLSDTLTGNHAQKSLQNQNISRIRGSQESLVKHKKYSDSHNFTQNIYQPTYSDNGASEKAIVNKNGCSFTKTKYTSEDLDQNVNSVIINVKNTIINHEHMSHELCYNHKSSHDSSISYPNSVKQPVRRNFDSLGKQAFTSKTTASNKTNIAGFNSESSSFHSRSMSNRIKNDRVKQTYPETNNVTLVNEGNGFGLGISKQLSDEMPVIDSITPNSPADDEGIFQLGDRVLSINGVSTSSLSLEEFTILKDEALEARTLTLKVEFDVYDEEYLVNQCFDVVLDNTLKIGLIFEDMKQGAPLFVKGLVKGSAAHRSGQVFPGDEIKFAKYKRKEVFDPLTSTFIAETRVVLTVFRDLKRILALFGEEDKPVFEVPQLRVPHPTPCHSSSSSHNTDQASSYANPDFHQKKKIQRRGENFVETKTEVRKSSNNIVIVDKEVTLYRDSRHFDFGILLADDKIGRGYAKDIRPDSPAHKSGVIQKGDRIVKVDGVLVNNNILQLFEEAGNKVDLVIRRKYIEKSKK